METGKLHRARLIESVKLLVEARGEPAGFDPTAWVNAWIICPLPALGGKRPADVLDSEDGVDLLIRLLEQSADGTVS